MSITIDKGLILKIWLLAYWLNNNGVKSKLIYQAKPTIPLSRSKNKEAFNGFLSGKKKISHEMKILHEIYIEPWFGANTKRTQIEMIKRKRYNKFFNLTKEYKLFNKTAQSK